jgi:enolase-phosphatase E1
MRPADRGVRLVLLDIEGTTTPMAFVHETLFPFARARMADWLRRHQAQEARDSIVRLAAEHTADCERGEAPPPWPSDTVEAAVAYAHWLMDRDRKSPALKHLQGLIWEEGYQAGQLHGEVYPDVAPAMRRWNAGGMGVAIYSSGSELAQRRLFASTGHGDLTPLIAGFFDTAVGAKVEAGSYRRIAAALGRRAPEVLFISDLTRELAAAEAAGCQVILSRRHGNHPQPDADRFDSVATFDDIR